MSHSPSWISGLWLNLGVRGKTLIFMVGSIQPCTRVGSDLTQPRV